MTDKVTSPAAFVLMKFHKCDYWNDPTYQNICEVIVEAGYQPLRSDQIPTSGPVVEEVCRNIREVPLLVIDTSGESHSVSYELGYAHGVGRSYDGTIVLRSVSSGQIPFNYAHFRVHMYKNRVHLKRLLRARLHLSTPLRDDQLGFALNFSVLPEAGMYGDSVAEAILDSLDECKYSGRCEYYAGEPFLPGEHCYVVGLGLKSDKGCTPDGDWWSRLCENVSRRDLAKRANVVLNVDLSELGELGGLKKHYPSQGTVELEKGVPVSILGNGSTDDSWFAEECRHRMTHTPRILAEQPPADDVLKAAPGE